MKAQAIDHIVVNSIADDPEICAKPGVMCLRNAVNIASTNDIAILITFSVSGTILLNQFLQNPNPADLASFLIRNARAPITIDGTNQQVSLDGRYGTSIFTLYDSQVTFIDLTIQNVDIPSLSAVHAEQSVVTVDKSAFIRDAGSNGAIDNESGSLLVTNSIFTDTFTSYSGAIFY